MSDTPEENVDSGAEEGRSWKDPMICPECGEEPDGWTWHDNDDESSSVYAVCRCGCAWDMEIVVRSK